MKGKKDNKEICIYSDAEIDEMCHVFRREGVNRIYTGHCTGPVAFNKLRRRLGNGVQRLSTGIRFEL